LYLCAVEFAYLMQSQWFRNEPVERDAIEALLAYFTAMAEPQVDLY